MKDHDLDILLAEYRTKKPTDFQMRKWKNAIRQEQKPGAKHEQTSKGQSNNQRIWLQLVAATILGFIVGALVFKTTPKENSFQQMAETESDNATIEYVLTKTN